MCRLKLYGVRNRDSQVKKFSVELVALLIFQVLKTLISKARFLSIEVESLNTLLCKTFSDFMSR